MDRPHLLEIDFRLRSDKRREFNSFAETVLSMQTSGFVRASTYEDRDDPNRILLVLEWSRSEHLQTYLGSEIFGALKGCLRTLGTLVDYRVVIGAKAESGGASGDRSEIDERRGL